MQCGAFTTGQHEIMQHVQPNSFADSCNAQRPDYRWRLGLVRVGAQRPDVLEAGACVRMYVCRQADRCASKQEGRQTEQVCTRCPETLLAGYPLREQLHNRSEYGGSLTLMAGLCRG